MKRYEFEGENGLPGCDHPVEDPDGEWVRYEDISPPAEQIAEAVTVARLPLLQAIKDLEAQVKVLREDREKGAEPVPAEKREGGVRRFDHLLSEYGHVTGFGDVADGKYMLFQDHLDASMDVVELARKPLIEQIKALEDQVREARDDARQDRMGFAGIVGMLRGVLCPPMDQDHLDELLEMVSSDNNETSNHAVKEIVVRILRVNQNPCGNCGS
jgi:hypothetical protein